MTRIHPRGNGLLTLKLIMTSDLTSFEASVYRDL
jgi:hypothetical protein